MERLLLPVVITVPLRGAHGSVWVTELVVNNRSDLPVELAELQNDCRVSAGCLEYGLQGQGTVYPILRLGDGPPTMFLFVEGGRAKDVDVHLRVRDLSRPTLTWGTQLPVVHESRALRGTSGLLDIPRDLTSRLRLRLYDFTPSSGHELRIRGYEIMPSVRYPDWRALPDRLLFDFVVGFQLPGRDSNKPGYWELDLSSVAVPAGLERFRILIDPSHEEMRYWAFVSITNNETQHITLITPN